jgi:predicted XRE-type DNA-binding protein
MPRNTHTDDRSSPVKPRTPATRRKPARDLTRELSEYLATLEAGVKPRLRKTTLKSKPDGTIERTVYGERGNIESRQTLPLATLRRRYKRPACACPLIQATPPRTRFIKGSGNVFADLGFAPTESSALLFRSDLMLRLTRMIARDSLTRAQAAKRFGVAQSRVALLLKGSINAFTVDQLVNMLARGGVEIEPRFVVRRKRVAVKVASQLSTVTRKPR